MAHFTTATVVYTVNLSPNTVQLQMHNAMLAARFDASLLTLASVTLTSDIVTNPTGTTCARTQVISLNTPPLVSSAGLNTLASSLAFLGSAAVPSVLGFNCTIESSSPADTFTGPGVGCQQINIAWTDTAGGAHNTTVNMAGQVPVPFGAANVAVITGFTFIAVGTWGANVGELKIRRAAPIASAPVVGGPFGGGVGPAAGIFAPGGPGAPVGSGIGVAPPLPRVTGRPTNMQGPYVPAGLAGANRGSVIAAIPDSFYTRFPDTNNAAQLRYFQNFFLEGLHGLTGPTVQSVPVLA